MTQSQNSANPLDSSSQLIKKYGLDAKKSLGQNFILNKNFTDKIAKSAGDLSDCEVLEIGPGPASLTRSILDAGAKKLIVIEKDKRFIPLLEELKVFYKERLEIINDDALLIDEQKIFPHVEKFKIIANLPYNIGTVLLIKWLKIAPKISSMTLMLQKEVAQRIAAKTSDKNYGRLAVMTSLMANSKIIFDVNRSVFTPPPKVTSAVIQITPSQNPLDLEEFAKIEKLVAAAFSQRRKMIKSCLKSFPLEIDLALALEKCEIKEDLRPENISPEKFRSLAKFA